MGNPNMYDDDMGQTVESKPTERERIEISKEDAKNLAWGDRVEGFEVVKDEITDTTRWSIVHLLVVKRLSDGKFFADTYSVGATECQDESPWEYDEPDFREVFPQQVTITVYK